MNVRPRTLATEQRGRIRCSLTHPFYHSKLIKHCDIKKVGIRFTVSKSISRQSLGHGDERTDSVEESSIDSLDVQPVEEDETNSNSNSDNEGDGVNPRSSILRRLARAVVTFMSPAPLQWQSMSRFLSFRAFKLAFFVALGLVMSYIGSRRSHSIGNPRARPQEVLYSDFLSFVSSGNVQSVRFEEGSGRLLFDVRESLGRVEHAPVAQERLNRKLPSQFYTRHLPDPNLITTLRSHDVEFGTIKPALGSTFGKILVTTLALWIPLLPMFIIMRRFLEGRNGGGRKKKARGVGNSPRVTFADVEGVDTAKRELEEVVACLKDSSKFTRVGAKLPSGVLLCGPPGTGKTLLAKAVAGEANVPFISVSASEFVELFVGRGAARVRELFAEARKRSPCVIFIDELDAIGGRRGAGVNEERDQTLNQLLTELDGFEGRPGIVLLAATNRAEVLDPALLRPGRLSRKVNVPLPDLQGRANIMMVHLRNIPVEGGLEGRRQAAEFVARLGTGFSGAELANVVNEGAFLAARREGDEVSLDDFSEAVLRTRFGVNGSQSEIPSWSKNLQKWLTSSAKSQSVVVRSQPLPGS